MSLTNLAQLSDWLLIVLSKEQVPLAPDEVFVRIAAAYGDQLTDDDRADDPDRPGIAHWRTRVYTARRYLGDDQLVLSNRHEWSITAAGRVAASVAESREHQESPAPMSQPPGQRRLLQPSVIAMPLLDPDERARIGLPTAQDAALSVVIELSLMNAGGAPGAAEQVRRELAQQITPTPVLDAADEYVHVTLSISQIQALVQLDQASASPAIHRVWPNFPVEALIDASVRTIKADAALRSFATYGDGITWAIVDSGIDGTHPHFATFDTLTHPDVKDLHRDFTGPIAPGPETAAAALTDDRGHGTHVAGIIAGGLPSDLAADKLQVVSEQYTDSDDIAPTTTSRSVVPSALAGMAPHAKLVSLKVLPKDGPSDMARVMAALRYVRQVNGDNDKVTRIHGVNISLGYEFDPRWFACGQSPLCKEVDRVVRAGVVVVVAAGNTGYGRFSAWERQTNSGLTMTINDPGNAERAITVGATHRTAPHTYGVSYFSSKGPTGDGRLKPDCLAPGERITSCSSGDHATRHGLSRADPSIATYAEDTGTSFAAPHVSGAIAAFLSARNEFCAQPEVVKDIFLRSAISLGRERYFEGAGLIDLMRALQAV